MRKKSWNFIIDGVEHTAEINHQWFSGKSVERFDGEIVYQGAKIMDTFGGARHRFDACGHRGVIHINYNGLKYTFDLSVDGFSVDTGKKVRDYEVLPIWVLIFIAISIFMPIVAIGGALGGAIAGGCIGGCLTIVRNSSRHPLIQVLICSVIVIIGSLLNIIIYLLIW